MSVSRRRSAIAVVAVTVGFCMPIGLSASDAHAKSLETNKSLAPTSVNPSDDGAHDLKLEILNPRPRRDLRRYDVYAKRGSEAPGTPGTPPHGRPIATVPTTTKAARQRSVVDVTGLEQFRRYTFMVYGVSRSGDVAGTSTIAVLVDDEGVHLSTGGLSVKGFPGAAFVKAPNGTEHALTSVQPTSSTSARGSKLTYWTKKAGANRWHRRTVPGRYGDPSHVAQLHLQLSTDGKHVQVAAATCDAISMVTTRVGVQRLPALAKVQAVDDCGDDVDGPLEFVGWAPLPNDRALVVLSDVGTQAPSFFITHPGRALHPAAGFTPTTGNVVSQIAEDSSTGTIDVLGYDADGSELWSRSAAGIWSGPAPTPLGPYPDSAFATMAAANGHLWIGTARYGDATTSGVPGKLLLTTRSRSGTWSPLARLPHTGHLDGGLLLAANPATGRLHAVWTRGKEKCPTRCSGLLHSAYVGGEWSTPRFLTHWSRDLALAVAFTKRGHPIVLYTRN